MYSAASLVHHTAGNVTIEVLNEELFPLHIPALIFVAICMVIGIIGNLFVIIIYKTKFRRSNHRYFILFLAVTDLLACCTGMPFLIVSLRLPYLMTSNVACKSIRYFHYFVNNSSGLLLLVIAVERFRRICRPLKTQVTLNQTLYICWGVVGFSAIMAAPSSVLFSASPIDTGIGNLTGHQCYVRDEKNTQTFFRVYMIVLMMETVICICIFALIYTFIIRTLWKSDQFLNSIRSTQTSKSSHQTPESSSMDFDAVELNSDMDSEFEDYKSRHQANSNGVKDTSTTNKNTNLVHITGRTGIVPKNVHDYENVNISKSQTLISNDKAINRNGEQIIPVGHGSRDKRHATLAGHCIRANRTKDDVKRAVSDTTLHKIGRPDMTNVGRLAYENLLAKKGYKKDGKIRKHSKTTARVTVMLFTVSLFFALAFIPHLTLMILASSKKTFVDELTPPELVAFQVFLRIFIINNVVNPIIYCVFDSRFRRLAKEVFNGKCSGKRDKNIHS